MALPAAKNCYTCMLETSSFATVAGDEHVVSISGRREAQASPAIEASCIALQNLLASSPELTHSLHTHCIDSASNAQELLRPTAQALWATTLHTAAVAPITE